MTDQRPALDHAPCFVCGFPATAAVVGLDTDPGLVVRALPFCHAHELEAVSVAEDSWSGPHQDVQVLFVNVEDLAVVLDELTSMFNTSAWVLHSDPEAN